MFFPIGNKKFITSPTGLVRQILVCSVNMQADLCGSFFPQGLDTGDLCTYASFALSEKQMTSSYVDLFQVPNLLRHLLVLFRMSDAVDRITAALASVHNENAVSLATLNVDFTLVKVEGVSRGGLHDIEAPKNNRGRRFSP